MRILGIDPGTAIIGYGMIECDHGEIVCGYHHAIYGAIQTDKDQTASARLLVQYGQLTGLIRSAKPDLIVTEKLFFARNVTTAIAVGQSRGIILLTAEQAGAPLFEYTPMQIKQQITGYGKADKKQIREMVKKIMQLDTERTKLDDAWDGLAIAITHCYLAGLAVRPEFIVQNTKH
ncbi:MAG: crossover junction endodeoxyribonuclease RuvC [Patescibacteria group bacterium]|jgi:crossover junction endodeoxyribonuclease RuvC